MSYVDRLLAPGEAIVHQTRRHWIVLMKRWLLSALVLAALSLVMAVLFFRQSGDVVLASAGVWIGLALAATGVVVALPELVRWSNEIYAVTDRRVVQVEGVFHKRVLDSSLSKVNDVRLQQSFTARLLGYGTLEIITASESSINRLEYLPRPLAFKKAMMAAAGSTVTPAAGEGDVAGSPTPRSPADRLADLEELRRRELVSEEEYRNKREEILRLT